MEDGEGTVVGYRCAPQLHAEEGSGCAAIVSADDFAELADTAAAPTPAPSASPVKPVVSVPSLLPPTRPASSGLRAPLPRAFGNGAGKPPTAALRGTRAGLHTVASCTPSQSSHGSDTDAPLVIGEEDLFSSPLRGGTDSGTDSGASSGASQASTRTVKTMSPPPRVTGSSAQPPTITAASGRPAAKPAPAGKPRRAAAGTRAARRSRGDSTEDSDAEQDEEVDDDEDDEEESSSSSAPSGSESDADSDGDGDADSEDSDDAFSAKQLSQQFEANAAALVSGELQVQRAPLLSSLNVRGCENAVNERHRRPFQPLQQDPRIARKLAANVVRVGTTLGINRRLLAPLVPSAFRKLEMAPQPLIALPPPKEAGPPPPPPKPKAEPAFTLPADFQPLVLWEPSDEDIAANPDRNFATIEVPPLVCRFLRPHQREGVQFLAECVLQQRDFDGQGAILADDMGLGKTLQSVTLIYTLLTQGFLRGEPVCSKVIVCCPTSLVPNWNNEFSKWLGKDTVKVVALSESSRDGVETGIEAYLSERERVQILVISYETFRRYAHLLYARDCDLLVCDEAHRLKNAATLTYEALNKLQCRRRVLLSGTPMQNDLSEFYAMVSFTNPGVLGDERRFNRQFQSHILRGREPDASEKEERLGLERAEALSKIVNQFILRRTNVLLSQHLPPKVIQIVCCRLSPLQQMVYSHMLEQARILSGDDSLGGESPAVGDDSDDDLASGGGAGGKTGRLSLARGKVPILPLIGMLKALCNHPKLAWDARRGSKIPGMGPAFEALFPPEFEREGFHPRYSGKMEALDRLLCAVRAKTDDKFVLVSNYTQTLDLFVALCKYRGWGYVRLDGSTSIKKRGQLVDELTAKGNQIFVFLLSSKAGGCGLNLIGANRLVLFDPDWNPAVDKQAAARVWRDGQKKRCFVYRFLAAGTIEEKVYQRQLSKEGLADVMGGNNTEAQVSTEDLRDLFSYKGAATLSDTHDTLDCSCVDKLLEPVKDDKEEEENGQEEDEEDADRRRSSQDSGGGSDWEGAQAIAALKAKKRAAEKAAQKAAERAARLAELAARPRLLWGQHGSPAEEDLGNWAHHYTTLTVPDPLFRVTHSSLFSKLDLAKPPPGAFASSNRMSTRTRTPLQPLSAFTEQQNQEQDAADWLDGDEPQEQRAAKTRGMPTSPARPGFGGKGAGGLAMARVAGPERTGPVAAKSPLRPVTATPAAPAAAATAHGRDAEEPVSFVFSCEVSGRPIEGPAEEACKRASCITAASAADTARALKLQQKAKARAERAAAEAAAAAAAAATAATEGAGDGAGMGTGTGIVTASIMADGAEAAAADLTSPKKIKSRLPSYLRPTPSPTAASDAKPDEEGDRAGEEDEDGAEILGGAEAGVDAEGAMSDSVLLEPVPFLRTDSTTDAATGAALPLTPVASPRAKRARPPSKAKGSRAKASSSSQSSTSSHSSGGAASESVAVIDELVGQEGVPVKSPKQRKRSTKSASSSSPVSTTSASSASSAASPMVLLPEAPSVVARSVSNASFSSLSTLASQQEQGLASLGAEAGIDDASFALIHQMMEEEQAFSAGSLRRRSSRSNGVF